MPVARPLHRVDCATCRDTGVVTRSYSDDFIAGFPWLFVDGSNTRSVACECTERRATDDELREDYECDLAEERRYRIPAFINPSPFPRHR